MSYYGGIVSLVITFGSFWQLLATYGNLATFYTEPAGRTSWMDQLDGPPVQTSWTDQLSLYIPRDGENLSWRG